MFQCSNILCCRDLCSSVLFSSVVYSNVLVFQCWQFLVHFSFTKLTSTSTRAYTICFSEAWCDDLNNFIYDLPNYTSSNQKRNDRQGGGVSVYIHNSLNFRSRSDLSTNCVNIESLTLEIISEKTRNILVSVLYKPPNGHAEHFENFLTNFFFQYKKLKPKMFISEEISILTYWVIVSIKKCRTI